MILWIFICSSQLSHNVFLFRLSCKLMIVIDLFKFALKYCILIYFKYLIILEHNNLLIIVSLSMLTNALQKF